MSRVSRYFPSMGFIILFSFCCCLFAFFYWVNSPVASKVFQKHKSLYIQSLFSNDEEEILKQLEILAKIDIGTKKKGKHFFDVAYYYASLLDWESAIESIYLSIKNDPLNDKAYALFDVLIENIDDYEYIAEYFNKLMSLENIKVERVNKSLEVRILALDTHEIKKKFLNLLDENLKNRLNYKE